MADPFVAEIRIFPFNFAPRGWAWCNGQLMPISQNTALFSLLGTTYGGDGKSTFGLPDLQGSVPVHVGGNQPGPGLSDYYLGEMSGTDNPPDTLNNGVVGVAGGSQPHENTQPFLCINFIISLFGIFPSQT